jgi:photosystem II stability/assembly factor-like uncharacterized protein
MPIFSRPRQLRAAVLAASLVVIAGCSTSPTTITFDEPTSSDALSSTTTLGLGSTAPPASATAGAEGQWVDVTANLVGLDSECGNLSFLSGRPDRDAMIAGVARQGLWTEENGADKWTQIGLGAGSAKIVNRPTAIIYDPTDPNRFWESGIYNGGGVYETRDGGATFTQLGDVQHSDSVSVDLSDPQRQTLVSGTHEQPTVFRSSNGGQTWQNISAGLPADIGYASFPHVVDRQTYLLGTKGGVSPGVLRTADGGTTWTMVHPGAVSGPPLVTKADGKIYWLLAEGGFITSTAAGATWTQMPGPVGGPSANLLELPDGRLATFGSTNLVVSEDQGAHWRAIGAGLPFEPVGLAYSATSGTFYLWQSTCDNPTASSIPVPAEAIMRLDGYVASA